MSARVRFIGHVDVAVDVPGPMLPLVLPPGLRLERARHGARLELQLRPDSTISAFVGRLSVPYLAAGRVRLATLDVPPPPPWRWGDVREMLAAASRLERSDSSAGGGLRRGASTRAISRDEVAWTALSRCSTVSSGTLARWPTRSVSRRVLHPVEQSRGAELIEITERHIGERLDLVGGAGRRIVPVATVRRVGQVDPWSNRSVSAVASQVCAVVRSMESRSAFGEVPWSMMAPIRALADRSRPLQPVSDPPFSSWPPAFVEAYTTCLSVLTTVLPGGRRSGWVPLSDLWRMFETWVAERLLAIITRLLGKPEWIAGERISCRWVGETWELELRHPCTFTDRPRDLVGSSWWSVSSILEPDVALIARGSLGPRLVVFDAKARGRLTSGDLATEASKYLWGIRRDDAAILGTVGVGLVSPFGGDPPYDLGQAAQWSLHGHPFGRLGAVTGQVGTDLTTPYVRDLLKSYLGIPFP